MTRRWDVSIFEASRGSLSDRDMAFIRRICALGPWEVCEGVNELLIRHPFSRDKR